MDIGVTCIVAGELVAICNTVAVFVEDSLRKVFDERSFGSGVEQFVVAIVAVDSNGHANETFSKGQNSVGRFKHPITAKSIKYMSLAICFDAEKLMNLTSTKFLEVFCSELLIRLDHPGIKIPKTFDYKEFSAQLKQHLEILKRVEIVEN
ncbi:hypothetical protein RF679_03255 [Undibacterium cyanobacteriorum]|uniref:Uncharacterized protein n=1 Tax=Undibacterium cyanobacteriorum TaxID=3073561 RepID=A0ABY9RJA3_9BURK|nr:hypothetical protein [Undibacterium sp. 20NA77.5]WMW81308.1 hypothetical protein RF679_03255 [Undibacterium sp. 20NA77.5]